MKNKQQIYEKALQFATEAHKGAFRKGTSIPYITHPVEAAEIVKRILAENKQPLSYTDDEIMSAAVLHDVVEDTVYTADDIEAEFGTRIKELVACETEDKREYMKASDSWKIRKEEAIAHLKKAPVEAKIITLGDKLSNARSLYKDYSEMGDALWQKFNQKDKSQQAWYYKSIAIELSELSFSKAYDEYCDLLGKIFD